MTHGVTPQLHHPIRLEPLHVERVWGGRRLAELFGRELPDGPIGESWEIHGQLKVASGPLNGSTLDHLVEEFGEELLGSRGASHKTFPLLTKWLDCRDWLSVQVHPDDALAVELTGDPNLRGKTEAWYVVHADRESRLIHGLKPEVSLHDLEAAQGDGVLQCLREVAPQAGDLLFTSAGTVHALGPGYVIYEIQQSSDLTYRLYDWGRDRPVHPAESLRCMRESLPCDFAEDQGLLTCPFFEIRELTDGETFAPNGDTFLILAAVVGDWNLRGEFGELRLARGESLLLPAAMSALAVSPYQVGKLLVVGLG